MRDREVGGTKKRWVCTSAPPRACVVRACPLQRVVLVVGMLGHRVRCSIAVEFLSLPNTVLYCTVPPRVTDALDGARHLLYLAFARHSQSATPQTNLQSRGPLISHPSKPYCTLCIPAVLVHGFFSRTRRVSGPQTPATTRASKQVSAVSGYFNNYLHGNNKPCNPPRPAPNMTWMDQRNEMLFCDGHASYYPPAAALFPRPSPPLPLQPDCRPRPLPSPLLAAETN